MKNEETMPGMDLDEFERRLRRQPMREIPPVWRTNILGAGHAALASRHSPLATRHSPWWRELLWPCPQAWAGLATVWLVILTVNFAARDPQSVREARKAATESRNILLAFKDQEQLLAELTSPPPPRQIGKPKPLAPPPRSQRREELMSA